MILTIKLTQKYKNEKLILIQIKNFKFNLERLLLQILQLGNV